VTTAIGDRNLLAFLPAPCALAAWLFWLGANGGYFPRDYLPAGLIAVVLVGILALFGGAALPRVRLVRWALLLFAAGVALSFLSIAWADSPGFAFESSVELATLLAIAWLVAIVPWTAPAAAAMVGLWVIGAAVICAIAVATTAAGPGSVDVTHYGRFAEPIGYTNGVAALGVMAFLPAVVLAARREVPPALQGVLLACAAFLLELAILPQSRAAFVALACGVPLILIFTPGRVALLARLVAVAIPVAFAIHPVLHVYDAATGGGDAMAALRSAWRAMAFTSLGAGVLGLATAYGQRQIRLRRPLPTLEKPLALRIGIGLMVVGAIAAVAVIVGRGGIHSGGRYSSVGGSGSRISSLDPEERLDYWRVALDMFSSRPIEGRGAGSFAFNYARDRHETKPSRYAHNIFLRILGETGLVGILLFLAMLVTMIWGLYAAWMRGPPLGSAIVSVVFAVGVAFLIHASLDWMDEIPALAAPALGLPLIAAGVEPVEAAGERSRVPRWATGLVAAGVVVAFVAVGVSWLSTLYLQRAEGEVADDPQAAFSDYQRAADLTPWSSVPLLTEGVVAIDNGKVDQARSAFEAAIGREDGAFPHLELAILAAEREETAAARRELELARALEPKSIPIRFARRQILSGKTLDAKAFNGRLLELETEHFTSPVS
jgi:hypothetical protein